MPRKDAQGQAPQDFGYEQLRTSFGWTGAAGMFGAIIFLIADALLYFTISGERDVPTIMSQLPLWRLYVGGALGIVGSWFYTIGAWQAYLAVEEAGRWWARGVFGAFAAMMIGTGAFHVAHAGLGLVARTAQMAQANEATTRYALDQSWGYLAVLVQFLTAPAIVLAVLYIAAVWSGRTRYPRWCVLITPSFVPFLYPAVDHLANATLSSIPYLVVTGFFYSVGFFLFFAVSTLTLWRRNRPGRSGTP
jgi:hypothetical protein